MANSSAPEIHERFGIHIDKTEAERAFVARAQLTISKVAGQFIEKRLWSLVIDEIATEIGRSDIKPKDDYSRYETSAFRTDISWLIGDSFIAALQSLEAVRSLFRENIPMSVSYDLGKCTYDDWVSVVISRDRGVLNVRWENGKFWPTGAPELDEKLIKEPLRWLRRHNLESVVKPMEKSLRHLLQGDDNPELYQDAITDAYESLEALAKSVTGKEGRDLSGSQQQVVSTLGMNEHYREMLIQYVRYGCQFRHGQQKPRRIPKREETEMFVYLTGAYIRFALEGKEQWRGKENNGT